MNEITQDLPAGISLTKLSIFSGLNEEELSIVKEALKIVHVNKGETVFKEGDNGEELFILLSGAMSAYCSQSDGTQRNLFDIKSGEFFGEMSIIANEPR
jgi:CRP-like cAMP-binding protein